MKFNPIVFEKLLFPLHKRVYKQIQETLDTIEEKHPGKLKEIIDNFEVSAKSDTQTETWKPGKAEEAKYPSIDISILFEKSAEQKIPMLHKSTAYKIAFDYREKPPSEFKGSHLVVGFFRNQILNSFIVPLEYLLGFDEKSVTREGSYQLYSHTILSNNHFQTVKKENQAMVDNDEYNRLPSVQQYHQKNSLIYIGITKLSWQTRYRKHCYDVSHGSNLRFHRALRGEFCQIGVLEHIVERAGLTEKQALEIEEKEVEKRSLHSLFPNGLNMIPGGNAGLKFVHNFANRTGYTLNKELDVDNVESILVDVQQKSLKKYFDTNIIERVKAAISRLWAEDTHFRVNAITGARNRFSFQQIQAARIWHSSGWSKEKILDYLQKMDSKKIGMEQLERLLNGETYASIPDFLV